jgi:hydroxyacylglutathione hydrolase
MARPVIEFKVAFETKVLPEGILDITAPMKEQIYVVEGKDKAMVIDNGMGIGSVYQEIRKYTSLPLVMVDTHGHPDHAGSNVEFGKCYLNFKDLPVYREMVTKEYRENDIRKIFGDRGKVFTDALLPYSEDLLPFEDGTVFDLGGRKLTAYSVPGHTEGSMVLYDPQSRTLFAGDALNFKETWLYLWYSTPLEVYYQSLLYLKSLKLDIARIFGGHIPNETDSTLIEKKTELVRRVLSGEIVGKEFHTFAGDGLLAEYEDTSIVYDPKRLR